MLFPAFFYVTCNIFLPILHQTDKVSFFYVFNLNPADIHILFCYLMSIGYSQSASLRGSTPNNCSAVYQKALARLLIQASPHPLLIAFRN